MPLKVVVELQIHAVSCPGVYLTEKNDVYLTVCVLGQCKETDCIPPVFPLLFHEKMWFEKVFENATDPITVVELLEKNVAKFRLSELIPSDGKELAFYETNTRYFLFPEPKLTPSYPGVDRELLMNTHPSFPGIAPKLEFSTRTTITELPLLSNKWYSDRNKIKLQRVPSTTPEKRSISPVQHKAAKSCKRLSRSFESRSASPSSRRRLHEVCRDKHQPSSSLRGVRFKTEADHRPPFVVRHVDVSKGFSEEAQSPLSYQNARQDTITLKNPHQYPLKRAISFDSWKATCPAAKVIREPAEDQHMDYESSFHETRTPAATYAWKTPGLCHRSSSPNHYESTSPSGRWASPQHRLYSSLSSSWEEINERVRNLLTSPEARERLSIGATDFEIDDVLERRSISLRSSPHCDSTEQRYSL
ncbi:spermatogenesis associated 6-like protein [Notechis scutatus]|uniref:Spermatogenesis associated 6-like protein n=1 Tax=Notechis scutatus TaxID=8663 RepID=A0A6J1UMH5_9SAUR|nr:spermatogenesis associated 6-like protein [Notechis scutatus]